MVETGLLKVWVHESNQCVDFTWKMIYSSHGFLLIVARKVITLVKQGCPAGITSSISFTDSHPAPYMRATTLSKSSVTYHLLFLNKVHIKFHTKCAFIKYQVLQIILTPCHTSENSLKMRKSCGYSITHYASVNQISSITKQVYFVSRIMFHSYSSFTAPTQSAWCSKSSPFVGFLTQFKNCPRAKENLKWNEF